MGVGLHNLHISTEADGGYMIELHLELSQDITLGEAHQIADEFKSRVQARASTPIKLVTHLEPIPEQFLEPGEQVDPDLSGKIEAVLKDHLGPANLLELATQKRSGHIHVSVTMQFSANSPLSDAHLRAENIERALHARVPEIDRVTVHVEPGEE